MKRHKPPGQIYVVNGNSPYNQVYGQRCGLCYKPAVINNRAGKNPTKQKPTSAIDKPKKGLDASVALNVFSVILAVLRAVGGLLLKALLFVGLFTISVLGNLMKRL